MELIHQEAMSVNVRRVLFKASGELKVCLQTFRRVTQILSEQNHTCEKFLKTPFGETVFIEKISLVFDSSQRPV